MFGMLFLIFLVLLEEFDFFFVVCCHAMLLSFFGLFIGSRFLCQPLICARNWIFQVSREQEKCLKKYFLRKFSMNSVLSPKSHCSLSLLCLGIICWLDLCAIVSILNMLIFVFVCALYVWCFISQFFCGLWEAFAFLLTAIWDGVLFSFSRLFIWYGFHCPPLIWHMSEYFRFLGSERSAWGNSSWISILRIPCSFLYSIVQYICYVWVLFFDFIYAVPNWFWLCWFPCFLVHYVFGFFFLFLIFIFDFICFLL